MEKSTRWCLLGGAISTIFLLSAVVLTWTRVSENVWLVRVLLGLSTFVIVAYLIAVLTWFLGQLRRQESQCRLQIERAQDAGRVEGFKTVARSLVADRDMLSVLWNWSSDQRTEHDQVSRPEWISTELLDRLMQSMRLAYIERVGTIVEFEPSHYSTWDKLEPRESSVVVEPGWRIGSETLKLPVVRSLR